MSSAPCESGTALHAGVRRNDLTPDASPDVPTRVQAFERYIARGKQPSDLRDWLEAEREYQARV